MRSDLRLSVAARFDHRCGYCGVRDTDTGAALTIDHFQPISHGGSDELENLVYCCHACNEIKGSFWSSEPSVRRLLHPRRDDIPFHLHEKADGTLSGLTATGVFHLGRLRLNRAELVVYRQRQRQAYVNEDIRQQIATEIERLQDEIDRLKARLKQWVH